MQIYYYQAPVRNFGDDLNAWLWPRIWPGLERIESFEWLIGIGSVLDGRLCKLPGRKLVVGAGYRPTKIGLPTLDELTILAVRGRKTCEALKLEPQLAMGDPAVLTPDAWHAANTDRRGIGFMPHYHTSRAYPIRAIVEDVGFTYIDPESEVDDALEALSGVDRIVTEAMHGAIVADALGVPWKRIALYGAVREGRESADFKWADWASVYDVDSAARHGCDLPAPARGLVSRAIRRLGRAGRLRAIGAELRRAGDASGFQLSDRGLSASRRNAYLELIQGIPERLREAGSAR